MLTPIIKPEWRTTTVVQLCQSMRESGDYSASPILADALQDAACDDDQLLFQLRQPMSRVEGERATACVFSSETAESVEWLTNFCVNNDCPPYEVVLPAAIGNHHENSNAEYDDRSSQWDEYLHFNGWSAHSGIPPEFWVHVERVTGKQIANRDRATSFSCSC